MEVFHGQRDVLTIQATCNLLLNYVQVNYDVSSLVVISQTTDSLPDVDSRILENVFLLQDLLNFEDPLNVEAAEHYERDKVNMNLIKISKYADNKLYLDRYFSPVK